MKCDDVPSVMISLKNYSEQAYYSEKYSGIRGCYEPDALIKLVKYIRTYSGGLKCMFHMVLIIIRWTQTGTRHIFS